MVAEGKGEKKRGAQKAARSKLSANLSKINGPHPSKISVAGAGNVRIGISGWRYKGWRGVFYPKGLPLRRELEYAASIFPSVEINGTFYSLQRPESFEAWAAATPDDFVFAVKGPRFITHMKKLKDCETPLANFFASGIFRLGHKLGPILWQLPPNLGFDAKRLETFFKLLPRDTKTAARLASHHDHRLDNRADLRPRVKMPIRHALEIRHESFRVPEFIHLLREHDIALVCADTVDWPRLMDLTSDFMYVRLHGSKVLYVSGYDDVDINAWACRVTAWATGNEPSDAECVIPKPGAQRQARDVYVYFDNDAKVRAPFDAQALMKRVNELLKTKSAPRSPGNRDHTLGQDAVSPR
jgi:uncharacterized protein YecE (DUF72 family)